MSATLCFGATMSRNSPDVSMPSLNIARTGWSSPNRAKAVTRLSAVNSALSSVQAEIEAANEAGSEGAWFMRNGAALLKRKQASPSLISVLDTLSRSLPVSAYLTGLDIQGDKVQLTGKAKNAAELIAALESSPLLSDVEFSAPTIRLPG